MMEFFKYKMLKITLFCLILLMAIILYFPFAYNNTPKPEELQTDNSEIISEQSENLNTDKVNEDETIADDNPEEHKSDSSKHYMVRKIQETVPMPEFEITDVEPKNEIQE